MTKDYYIVLGVSREADLKKIKKAYRTVAKKYHPDITRTRDSADQFLEIKEAFETLGDEEKRRKYDEELLRESQGIQIHQRSVKIEPKRSFFADIEPFYTAVDEFFEGFIPGFFNLDKGRLRTKDLFFEAILSPYEANTGGLYPITVPVMEPCPVCSRSGSGADIFCLYCSGRGGIRSERTFSLSIPPNIRHGDQVRISLEDIGIKDAYLNVRVVIDPSLDDWE
ncbi:MAG: DnaJ domain-containing protein [Deltaproteobacteria bacterium]|nr:DnaJ domain-containing protein [Deltaproteobacteria bacterium]